MPTVLHIDGKNAGLTDHGDCRVYWGSHGCNLERGHDGPHHCDCADEGGFDPETREYYDEPGVFNVGAPPYYGPETSFYGEDATPKERGET